MNAMYVELYESPLEELNASEIRELYNILLIVL